MILFYLLTLFIRYIILLHILIVFIENFGSSILENIIQVLSFIKVILENKREEEETILLVLGLLETLLGGV